MTDRPLLEIEQILTRHGGGLNGAAGPILAVSSRTYDILPGGPTGHYWANGILLSSTLS